MHVQVGKQPSAGSSTDEEEEQENQRKEKDKKRYLPNSSNHFVFLFCLVSNFARCAINLEISRQFCKVCLSFIK